MQEHLKAPLNSLCVARGESDADGVQKEAADGLHKGALAGWECNHRHPPPPTPSSGKLRPSAHTLFPGPGGEGRGRKDAEMGNIERETADTFLISLQ